VNNTTRGAHMGAMSAWGVEPRTSWIPMEVHITWPPLG